MAWSVDREQIGRFAEGVVRAAKVALFTAVGLAFVFVAALLISIIQFQIRIIEAKNQSKNFTLVSLAQSVAMQKEFVEAARMIREQERIIALYQEFMQSYLAQLPQFASVLCHQVDDKDKRTACMVEMIAAIKGAGATALNIKSRLAQLIDKDVNQFGEGINNAAESAAKLAAALIAFQNQNGERVATVRYACARIDFFLAALSDGDADSLAIGPLPVSRSFSREFVLSKQMQCRPFLGVAPAVIPAAASATDARAAPTLAATTRDPNAPAVPRAQPARGNLENDLDGALFFDLVSYSSFYERLLGERLTELAVIAPIDSTFVLLVIFCGALGAMLRLTAQAYNPALFGKDRTEARQSSLLYYFVIGIMCALIIYILAKTAFAGITETAYLAKSGTLSPFVVAFLAVVSGLICEEAFQQIVTAGKALLTRTASAGKTE